MITVLISKTLWIKNVPFSFNEKLRPTFTPYALVQKSRANLIVYNFTFTYITPAMPNCHPVIFGQLKDDF